MVADITPEEARQLLSQDQQSQTQDISPEEARQLLSQDQNQNQSGLDILKQQLPGAMKYIGQSALSAANRLPRDVLAGATQAGQGLAGLLFPNTPRYDWSKFYGVQNPDWADKTVQALTSVQATDLANPFNAFSLAKKAPLLFKMALGAGQQGFTGASLGAGISPQDTNTGFGIGAGVGAGLPLVGKLADALAGLTPTGFAKNMLSSIKGGETLQENNQSLSQDVQDQFNADTAQARQMYKQVLDAHGDKPLLGKSDYLNLDKKITDSYIYNINKMHNIFLDNPTFENAHWLQSQLGIEASPLQSGKVLSPADRDTYQMWTAARNALKNDMQNFLQKQGGDNLVRQYNNASDNFIKNVIPYRSNPTLYNMAIGDIGNPTSGEISTAFSNPESEVQGIVDKMGDNAKNKILYSDLGKLDKSNVTGQKLKNAIESLGTKNKALDSYRTDKFDNLADALYRRITAKKVGIGLGAVTGVGALAGALAPELLKHLNIGGL